MEPETKKRDYLLPASILVAALLVSGSLIYNAGKKSGSGDANTGDAGTYGASAINLKDVIFKGDSKAPVTIVEYSDYQCPFCGRFFEETEPLIRSEYVNTGKVKMVYKDLAFLGTESKAAAEAVGCASEQGKFWEYHDAVFQTEINEDRTDNGVLDGSSENSGNLKRELFLKLAQDLKLDANKFVSCLDSRKYQAKVEKDITEAREVMSTPSTPTFFINDKMIQGALPYVNFKQAIDEALK